MSKKDKDGQIMQYDNALQVWSLQNELLLTYGIDTVKRSFTFNGDIDKDSFHQLDIKMSLLERNGNEKRPEPIIIRVSSGGGDISAAWAMAARIMSSPCDVVVETYGEIMSSATILLAAADKRRSSRYCIFMFHEASAGIEGKVRDIQDTVKYFDREEQMYCDFLGKKSKRSSKFWKKMLSSKKDVYLDVNQMILLGLIDEVF